MDSGSGRSLFARPTAGSRRRTRTNAGFADVAARPVKGSPDGAFVFFPSEIGVSFPVAGFVAPTARIGAVRVLISPVDFRTARLNPIPKSVPSWTQILYAQIKNELSWYRQPTKMSFRACEESQTSLRKVSRDSSQARNDNPLEKESCSIT